MCGNIPRYIEVCNCLLYWESIDIESIGIILNVVESSYYSGGFVGYPYYHVRECERENNVARLIDCNADKCESQRCGEV